VTIPCVAEGVPTPNVEFLRDGTVLIPDNSRVIQSGQFLIISRATISDDGSYSCRAENPAGIAISDEARLIVFRKSATQYKHYQCYNDAVLYRY